MKQQDSEILWNRELTPGYWRLGLSTGEAYAGALPGQFVMVREGMGHFPLLRRPFSIHRLIREQGVVAGIEVLYRVVGQGTQILSELKTGDALGLLGPLGRGFRIPEASRRIDVAAGGIGVAPMVFLLDHLMARSDLGNCRVFLGGRSSSDLLCRKDFEAMGVPVILTTDDGSEGDQCFLTHPLEEAVRTAPPDLIVACGPMGMLGCVAGIARDHGISCQVSLESAMACGIGACLGCAVKPAAGEDHFLHVCKDGPVFDIDQIDV